MEAPAEFILMKPLMPKVEGKKKETILQNIWMWVVGQENPEMKSRGTEVHK